MCHQECTCVPLVVGGPQLESSKALFYYNHPYIESVNAFFPKRTVCEPRGIRTQPSSAQVSHSWWGIVRRPLSFVLSEQAEVCAGVLGDVIRCVLSGSDGCLLGLGCADVGE